MNAFIHSFRLVHQGQVYPDQNTTVCSVSDIVMHYRRKVARIPGSFQPCYGRKRLEHRFSLWFVSWKFIVNKPVFKIFLIFACKGRGVGNAGRMLRDFRVELHKIKLL